MVDSGGRCAWVGVSHRGGGLVSLVADLDRCHVIAKGAPTEFTRLQYIRSSEDTYMQPSSIHVGNIPDSGKVGAELVGVDVVRQVADKHGSATCHEQAKRQSRTLENYESQLNRFEQTGTATRGDSSAVSHLGNGCRERLASMAGKP